MHHSLNSLIPAPDSRSVAVAARLTTMQAGESADPNAVVSDNQSLSEAIEQELARQQRQAEPVEAQEPPREHDGIAQNLPNDHAASKRLPSSAVAASGKTKSPPATLPAADLDVKPSPQGPGRLPQIKSNDPAMPRSGGKTVVPTVASGRLPGVPAAVIRAIEVESVLTLGGKTDPRASRTPVPSGIEKSGPRLAQAESRTVRGLTLLSQQQGGRIRIQLEPLQLGPISIEVQVNRERVTASIETSTRGAQRILEAATSRLRHALEAQGFSLDRLEIRPESGPGTADSPARSEEDSSSNQRSDRARDEPPAHSRHHSRRRDENQSQTFRLEDFESEDHQP